MSSLPFQELLLPVSSLSLHLVVMSDCLFSIHVALNSLALFQALIPLLPGSKFILSADLICDQNLKIAPYFILSTPTMEQQSLQSDLPFLLIPLNPALQHMLKLSRSNPPARLRQIRVFRRDVFSNAHLFSQLRLFFVFTHYHHHFKYPSHFGSTLTNMSQV